jgi:hypothetical protein
MSDHTITILPDGDPDYLGGGPTADTFAENTNGTLAVSQGNGMQVDSLHCGKSFVKGAAGVKRTVFARFRADIFHANMYPTGVRLRFVSSGVGTTGMQFRVGFLTRTFRPNYKIPPGLSEGGFHSGNYPLQRDMPHFSGVATVSSNSDSIVAGSVYGVPLTISAPATPIGTAWSTGYGSATPYDLANDLLFAIGVGQSANNGESVLGIAIDAVNLPVGTGTALTGLYFWSAHAQDGLKPPIELRIDWADHRPAITSSDPSAEIPLAPFSFAFVAAHDSAPVKPGSGLWNISSPPGGEESTIDPATGVFNWLPTGAGSFTWAINYQITSEANSLFAVVEQIYASPTVLFTLTVTPASIAADTGLDVALAAEAGQGLAVDATAGIGDQVIAETGIDPAVESDTGLEFAIQSEVGFQ